VVFVVDALAELSKLLTFWPVCKETEANGANL